MKLFYLPLLSLIFLAQTLAFPVYADQGGIKITNPDTGHKIFTKALNDKNLEALVSMYANDAIMIAPGNKKIQGKEAIRAFFVETLKSIESITLKTVFRINYKDIVVFRSKYTVTFKTADGKTISQSTSGIEVEQKQKDGSWLFIVDHHYGGADFADFQGLNKQK